jgi:hypothetical protein
MATDTSHQEARRRLAEELRSSRYDDQREDWNGDGLWSALKRLHPRQYPHHPAESGIPVMAWRQAFPGWGERVDKEYAAALNDWYVFLARTYVIDRAAWERMHAAESVTDLVAMVLGSD